MVGKQFYVALDREELPGLTILVDCPVCGADVHTLECQECGADVLDEYEKGVEKWLEFRGTSLRGAKVA